MERIKCISGNSPTEKGVTVGREYYCFEVHDEKMFFRDDLGRINYIYSKTMNSSPLKNGFEFIIIN